LPLLSGLGASHRAGDHGSRFGAKRCDVCGGAHDGDWHQWLGCTAVWQHMKNSSPGMPASILDDPLLQDATD
jgi:hypothetical protein